MLDPPVPRYQRTEPRRRYPVDLYFLGEPPSMNSPAIISKTSQRVPSTWHLQIDGKRRWAERCAAYTRDYAAMVTPVTSAQVAKAWTRPDRRFAAVS
jgi:hypothetical protein